MEPGILSNLDKVSNVQRKPKTLRPVTIFGFPFYTVSNRFLQDRAGGKSSDRSATSSRRRASSIAPPPWNSGAAVSELWKYFTRPDATTAKCSLCEFTLQRENNKTTGPLWGHLRDEHVEVFEKTDYCRGRKVKEVRIARNGSSGPVVDARRIDL